MRRLVGVLILLAAVTLAGCGRETSVDLSEGSLSGEASGERSMSGDPDDTLGGPEPGPGDEAGDPDTPVSSAPSGGKSTAPAPSGPTAPAASGSSPGSTGSGPSHGIAPGEPHPDNPDGCPECTTSTTPAEPVDEPRDDSGDNSGDGAYTTPRPGQEDVRAREWESAEVAEDDVTVTLTWWSGVEPCTVLDRVEVREEADKVVITLYEGNAPGDEGACPAVAVERRTRVQLSAPLAGRAIVDGAKAK